MWRRAGVRGEAGLMAESERDARRVVEVEVRVRASVRTRDTRLRYRRSARKSWIQNVSMSQSPRLGKISRKPAGPGYVMKREV